MDHPINTVFLTTQIVYKTNWRCCSIIFTFKLLLALFHSLLKYILTVF